MTQSLFSTIDPDSKTGSALADDLNNLRETLRTGHRGSAAPSYVSPGLIWIKEVSASKWDVMLHISTSDNQRLFSIDPSSYDADNAALGSGFASGDRLISPTATAPTGWTQVTGLADKVIRIVDGAGGGTGGSWTLSGLTVGDTTLSENQGAVHDHDFPQKVGQQAAKVEGSTAFVRAVSGTDTTELSAGGDPHDHPLSSDGSWRPAYLNSMVIEKD